jgi:hypothetical protein
MTVEQMIQQLQAIVAKDPKAAYKEVRTPVGLDGYQSEPSVIWEKPDHIIVDA